MWGQFFKMTEIQSSPFFEGIQDVLRQTTPVDWAVGLYLGWCVARGAVQGFGHELGRMVVVGVALIGGIPLFSWLMEKVREAQPDLENQAASELLCFVITFFLLVIVARLVHLVVRSGVERILTGWFSNVMGGLSGFVRGGIVYGAILLIIGGGSLGALKRLAIETSWIGSRVEPKLHKPYRWLAMNIPILPGAPPPVESGEPMSPKDVSEPPPDLVIERTDADIEGDWVELPDADLPLAPPPLDVLP